MVFNQGKKKINNRTGSGAKVSECNARCSAQQVRDLKDDKCDGTEQYLLRAFEEVRQLEKHLNTA